ncbi:MAG: hypothetical protein AABX04_03890 [Nanoarchaeota archaeon]
MPEEQELGRKIELKMEQEQQVEVQKAVQSEEDSTPSNDNKSLVIMLLVIVGIFVVAFSGFKVYDYFTAAAVINVDELHQDNLQGDLNEKEGYVYDGYSFVFVDGLWWTEVNRFGTLLKIPLHFGAREVDNVSIIGQLDTKGFNAGDSIYIAIDPNIANKYYSLALSELSFNIVKGIDKQIVTSCTENNSICDNRTIVNCENTQGKPVVQLAVENTTKIEFKGTCIKIAGNGYDLVRATDRVLLRWYGIMS